jgi:hypothetical protein
MIHDKSSIKLALFLFSLFMIRCTAIDDKKPSAPDLSKPSVTDTSTVADFTVATKFINDYVRFLHEQEDNPDTTELNWIMQQPLLSTNFKTTYKNMVEAGRKADPELGLDFDPILDAQDFPDAGYEIASADPGTNYLVMKAKDEGGFNITMKLTKQKYRWVVDGCGAINIPDNMRAGRD